MAIPAAAVALALLLGGLALGSKKPTPPLDPGMPPDLDARVKNALATVTDPNVLDQLATSMAASGYTNSAQALRLRAAQLRGQVSVPGVPTTPGTPPIIPPGDMPPPIEPPRPPPVYVPPGGNIPGTNWPIPPPGMPTVPLPPPPGWPPTAPPFPTDGPPQPPYPQPPGTIPPLPPTPPITVPIEDLDKNIPPALAAAVAALLAKPNWTDADLQTADALAITLDQQGFPIAAAKIKSKALAVRALRAGAGVLVDIGKILTTPGGKLPPLPPTIPTTPPIVTTPPSVPPVIATPGAPPPKPTGPIAKTYKVLAGDNPSSIALKFTGNGANFRELAAANPDKSARILAGTIYAGEIMTLPDKWPATPAFGTPPPASIPGPLPPLAGTHATIRQGSTGPDVRLWQTIVGVPADGQFGPQTHGATVTWQRTRGLVADGIVGPATWAKAQGAAAPPPVVSIPIPIPGMPSIPIPVAVPPIVPVSMPVPTAPAGPIVIKEGSRGPDVMMWQKIIGVTADGIFGPGTAAATRAWQAARGLVADGIVGPATWSKALSQVTASAPAVVTQPPPLFPVPAAPIPAAVPMPPPIIPISAVVAPPAPAPPPAAMPPPTAPTPTPVVSKPTIREGSTGPDVVTWQKIVGVAADGKFGPGTKAATIAWQKQKGLVADGIVGPKSWAAAIPLSAAAGYGGRGPRYKVKRGDTPFSISKQFTGDPMRMFELAHANPHAARAIENGILFQGQVLFLPPTWNIARPSTQAAAALSGVLEIIGGHHAAGQSGHHWGA